MSQSQQAGQTNTPQDATPRIFSSINDIENMLIGVGAAAIVGLRIGRTSNYAVQAPVREAVRNDASRAPVGRIFQHVTPDKDAPDPKVSPRVVIFYFQEETTNDLYLLQTTKGGGGNNTNRYNVYLNNGTFSTGGWIWGLQNETGLLCRGGKAVYAQAPNNSSSSVTAPTGSTTQRPSSSSSVPNNAVISNTQPTASAPTKTAPVNESEDDVPAARTRARSRAVSVPANTAFTEDEGEISGPIVSGARRATNKKTKQRSTKAKSPEPPSIPKSFAGVKKPEKKSRKRPVRSNDGDSDYDDDDVDDDDVNDEEEEDEVVETTPLIPAPMANVPTATAPTAKVKTVVKHTGGGREGTRSGVAPPLPPSVAFPKRSEAIKPASHMDSLPTNIQSNTRKRKLSDTDTLSDEEVSKRYKFLANGWNNTGSETSDQESSFYLSRASWSRFTLATEGDLLKDMYMGGELAQHRLSDTRKIIKFEDARSVFGAEAAGKTLQVEVAATHSAAAGRMLRPHWKKQNQTLTRLDREKAKADRAAAAAAAAATAKALTGGKKETKKEKAAREKRDRARKALTALEETRTRRELTAQEKKERGEEAKKMMAEAANNQPADGEGDCWEW